MKKSVNKKFNISNKLSYTIIVVLAILLIGVSVYAYGTSSPSTFGHSMSEIAAPSGCSAGQFLSWTGSAWSCVDSSIENLEIYTQSYADCSGGQTFACSSGTLVSGGCLAGVGNSLRATNPTSNSWHCMTSTSGGCTVYVICTNA